MQALESFRASAREILAVSAYCAVLGAYSRSESLESSAPASSGRALPPPFFLFRSPFPRKRSARLVWLVGRLPNSTLCRLRAASFIYLKHEARSQ